MDSLLNRVRKVTAKTAQSLRRELRFIEQEKHRLTAELDSAAQRIAESIAQLDSGAPTRSFAKGPGAPRGPRKGPRKGTRIRRSPEQLKNYANDVYDLIKQSGTKGAGGGDIRKQYPNVGQDIRGFLQKHGGYKLKTSGKKSFMRYMSA